ncbi:LacI family DNA-binding transcriptional regulator [Sagittula salina]|uniref:Substrate-binding domain-containing protein n=1 Tax=Sagittula salina TaxID=2820268 RepID=A0A940MS13_9RHOB|nr:substrate-binding domain-containing protein [Sagittula salina]MBP0484918.1 substrate-binding domain-containing protein [Sagittula salina]
MTKQEKKPVTLRQVAEHAGVSAATASLVLNGKGEISEATRQRVLSAVREMNYTPRGGRTKPDSVNTLRFLKIARHGHTVNRDHSHFIADYIDGMSWEATRRDYSLQVESFEGVEIDRVAETLRTGDLRGAVILGTELDEDEVRFLARAPLPMVFIDTYHPLVNLNFVDMDNDQAVFAVLRHLSERGFRRIGMVGSHTAVTNFALRREAFSRGMAALGLEVDEAHVLSVDSTLEGAYGDGLAQLGTGRDVAEAYFCANDMIAFGFMKALRERGLEVPRDVSIVGFDNLPMSAMSDPPLSTIEVPKRRIGAMAIRLLDDMLIATTPEPATKALISGEFVSRDSVGFGPARTGAAQPASSEA